MDPSPIGLCGYMLQPSDVQTFTTTKKLSVLLAQLNGIAVEQEKSVDRSKYGEESLWYW